MLRNDFVAIGSIIIDDIVLSNGRRHTDILGGGALHAASGMRVWTEHVGLISAIGNDFPTHSWWQLSAVFDLQNVALCDTPTPRAMQIFDNDDNRTELFRTDWTQFTQLFDPRASLMGEAINVPLGIYLLGGQVDILRDWIACLRTRGNPVVLWEPWDIFMQSENRQAFRELAPLVNIFSPNLIEAQRMTGERTPDAVVQALLTDGAQIVALRMGEHGSLIARDEELIRVPALSFGSTVDVTGAGNAYCGGFVVGFVESGSDLQHAGLCGAVAASFALTQFGVFLPDNSTRAEARRRFRVAKTEIPPES